VSTYIVCPQAHNYFGNLRDEINVDATAAITKVNDSFPNAQIGLCGIMQRKGTSNNYLKNK
jgi:hypothetical protein